MAVVKDILRMLEDFAPVRLKMDFDNVGLLVGYAEDQVDRILISLDITEEVIAEAIGENAQLIVSHHPFFTVNSVTDGDGPAGKSRRFWQTIFQPFACIRILMRRPGRQRCPGRNGGRSKPLF